MEISSFVTVECTYDGNKLQVRAWTEIFISFLFLQKQQKKHFYFFLIHLLWRWLAGVEVLIKKSKSMANDDEGEEWRGLRKKIKFSSNFIRVECLWGRKQWDYEARINRVKVNSEFKFKLARKSKIVDRVE